MKRTLQLITTLCLLLCVMTSFAQVFSARVDRSRIIMGETLQLILVTDKASSNDRPDLGPLTTDFTIIGQEQSTRIQILNGHRTQETQWLITLGARKVGQLQIPSIKLGKLSSKPIDITVNTQSAATADKPQTLFLKTEVSTKSPFVQEQVLYTLKIYSSVDVFSADLQDPKVSNNADVVQLGNDVNYRASIGGKRYEVLERRYAIFPQESGELTINGPVFSATLASNRANRFNGPDRALHRVAPDETLTVKGIPPQLRKQFGDQPWIAAEQLKLTENWSAAPSTFKVGEPITRTLSVRAVGLAASQLPDLSKQQTANFKQYADQAELKNSADTRGLVGVRTQKIAYIPTKAGTITLPAITLHWFNNKTKRVETVSLATRKLIIANTPNTNTSRANAQARLPQPINLNAPATAKPLPASSTQQHNPLLWQALAAGFFLLWLLTLFVFLRKKSPTAPLSNNNATEEKIKIRRRVERLKHACKENNAEKTHAALLSWAHAKWPDQNIHNTREIEALIVNTEFNQALNHLSEVLYRKPESQWTGREFWQRFKAIKVKQLKACKNSDDQLPPLYPES